MDLGLRDRVYLVTGGSRGLGFAAAQALVGEGAKVVLTSPHEATASAAADRLARSGTAANTPTWIVADNADPATPGRLIAAAKETYGRIDGALVSVGGTPTGSVASTTDDAWRAAFESVFLGAIRLGRVLAAELGSEGTSLPSGTGASLVFVLASSVRAPLPNLAISNGLFPGLAGVVKTLADEHGPAGVRINGLLPVRIATDRVREIDALAGDPDEVRAQPVGAHPATQIRGTRRVRPSCRLLALSCRVLRHGSNDPSGRRRHPLDLKRGACPDRRTIPCRPLFDSHFEPIRRIWSKYDPVVGGSDPKCSTVFASPPFSEIEVVL